jgi:hypothetical protein
LLVAGGVAAGDGDAGGVAGLLAAGLVVAAGLGRSGIGVTGRCGSSAVVAGGSSGVRLGVSVGDSPAGAAGLTTVGLTSSGVSLSLSRLLVSATMLIAISSTAPTPDSP